ncbi:medium-chain fatty acid ethyl ester synthase/esteras-like protein 1 [Massarina eburnea CBS 473.64]|uniref:alcohol O-acetyltransferase n=1 Tax=Massarina eburnea CBS 473.64 TaxID=1395130 RepID=A0A6A6RYH9_9PLEO|nr:medium-chain fatty acid ethyl ester synthase/esteras-like protein 1 [Massarina eburnea CBS 473.64]
MAFLLGHATTAYTHHPTPITLPTKTGEKTPFQTFTTSALPPCTLNPLLFNGHLQTMYTAVKAAGPPIHYKRQIFTSTHSIYPGTFAVDFVVPKKVGEEAKADEELPERTTLYTAEEWEMAGEGSEDDTPMLISLHGLSGGSHEIYLREVLEPITAKGWAACVVNARGCALSKITTPHLFNARATWDVRQTIHWLREKFPKRPLYAVGYSLGANILTNYVGEEGDKCVLKAAIACSNPWNLELCNVGLQKSWVGLEIYSRTMGQNLLKLYEKHQHMILKNPNISDEKVRASRYLYEFDRAVQAPTWGYPTENAYYRDAQSVDALLAIKIPFLAINATDDPISLVEAIPYEEFRQNPYTVLCTTNWGGHLSWFQSGGKRWFATAIANFLTKMHDEIDVDAPLPGREDADAKTVEKKYPIYDPCNRKLILPDA